MFITRITICPNIWAVHTLYSLGSILPLREMWYTSKLTVSIAVSIPPTTQASKSFSVFQQTHSSFASHSSLTSPATEYPHLDNIWHIKVDEILRYVPEVWNMTCICCRSVFHLSHYVTKPVSTAAASRVHGVKSLKYGKVTPSLCSVRGQHTSERRQSSLQRVLGAGQHPFVTCSLQPAAPALFALEPQPLGDNQPEADNLPWAMAWAGFGPWCLQETPTTASARSVLYPKGTAWEQLPNAIEFWLQYHNIFDEVITLLH